jgi:hypothetical protein
MGKMKNFDLALYSSVSDAVYSIIEDYSLSCSDIEKIEWLGAEALEYFFTHNNINYTIEYYGKGDYTFISAAWMDVDERVHCGLWYTDRE